MSPPERRRISRAPCVSASSRANREAQPRAVCAPGHKRLEQPITQRDWYSGAGIFTRQ